MQSDAITARKEHGTLRVGRRIAPLLATVFFLALVLSLGGCGSPKLRLAPGETVKTEIHFFDSFSFDRALSAALASDAPEVKVLFPASFTINGIPERLDKWFFMVEKYDGMVELQPEPEAGKGMISEVLSLFVQAYDYMKEKWLYGPVADYNVTIFYQTGNGIVTKVVFSKK